MIENRCLKNAVIFFKTIVPPSIVSNSKYFFQSFLWIVIGFFNKSNSFITVFEEIKESLSSLTAIFFIALAIFMICMHDYIGKIPKQEYGAIRINK